MPRKKDPIWVNFEEQANPSNARITIAKCTQCEWKHWGYPERMKAHFATHKTKDTASTSGLGPATTTKILPTRDSAVIATSSSYKMMLDHQIAKYFFATNTPFHHASNKEFINTVQLIRPGYSPPSSKQIAGNLLNQVHSETLELCKSQFHGKTVTMALDGWSNVHVEPIIGFSISDAAGNYALTNSVDTSGNSHTTEYLKTLADAEIGRCEQDYGVRIGSFVTDNTANVAKLRREIDSDTNLDIIQYGCSAHILDLLSKDVKISNVAVHIIKIIKYFKFTHLPAAWYKQAGGKRLVLPVDVRWNTIYDSIASYLKNRGVLIQVCQDRGNDIDKEIRKLVNDSNLSTNATDYSARMKPIAIALDRAQRNQTTIAVAVEIWHNLEKALSSQPKNVKTSFLNRKGMALGPNHFLANMVDHRFCGQHLSPEEKELAYERLTEINEEFVPILLAHCAQAAPFKSYLYLPSVRSTNPITWWKSVDISEKNGNFDWKMLKKDWIALCEQLMSGIATTAQLERIFSTKKLVQSKLRNRLGNLKAGKLTFIYKFLNVHKETQKSNLNWVWEQEQNEELEVEIVDDSDDSEDEHEVINLSENEDNDSN